MPIIAGFLPNDNTKNIFNTLPIIDIICHIDNKY